MRWKIVVVMTARVVVAGVVIGLLGVCQLVQAQGKNFPQPFEQRRTVGVMTPGSLYKNQPFNQNLPGTFNKPGQSGNRSYSTVPQNVSATQPLYKPAAVNTSQQPSPFSATPKTTTPQASPFTLSQPTRPTSLQQPPPLYNMGQQPAPQQPSPYSAALSATPLSPPIQQPIYSMTPQFTTVSPLSLGGLPNPSVTTPAKQPFYSMGQQVTAPQPLRPAMPQSGVVATPQQPPAMTGPQSTPAPKASFTPLSASALSTPLTTPLVTPLATPLQQPFYMPQPPFAGSQTPPQR